MILLDSDHLSIVMELRDARRASLVASLEAAEERAAIPLVVVEEQLRAWLAPIRRVPDVRRQIEPYVRLSRLIDFLRPSIIVNWDEEAANLFKELRKSGIRIGTQDLKIACTAMANDALLLSANLRDFEQVPGLRVEDWLR
jgi:tRNA(fMet)-specific endonuclease VapC